MHGAVSDKWPQAAPPKPTWVSTARERERTPPSQLAVHVLHPPQSAVMQSRGHACELQLVVSLRESHATPPCAGLVSIDRWRVLLPPPQEREHVSQLP